MDSKNMAFLKKLVETPSPSGYEAAASKVWAEFVGEFASPERDVHGNCWAVLNPKGKPVVMLAGHIDEIGLIVTYIDGNGFIHFSAIGGIDWNIMPGSRVYVHTENGDVLGVLGRKPIHLIKPDDRKRGVEERDLWIDIGAQNKKEAEKLVSVGDPVTIAVGMEELRNNIVVSRACDDKTGAYVVARTMQLLAKKKIQAAVYGVATVQEEIGLRGARTSAFRIDPDVGIAIDVTHASDQPTVDPKQIGDVKLGGGPVICRGPNINPVVYRRLVQAAKKSKLSYQLEASGGGTGTDANAMQISRAGVATALVSIPNRYMHTPVELVSLDDLEGAAKLLAAFIEDLTSKVSFIP